MPVLKKSRRPDLPHEEFARKAALPKPQYVKPADAIDTSELPHRKIHPRRARRFLDWLKFRPCAVAGKVDQLTEQLHVCWFDDDRRLSDPAHLEKAITGKIKTDDRYAIPLCRHAHRMQEGDDRRFARRFGIDTVKLAEDLFAQFCEEEDRRR